MSAAETYTVVLRNGSHFIDAATRKQIMIAQRHGANVIAIRPSTPCGCCAQLHEIRLELSDVVAFLEHVDVKKSNIVPFTGSRP